MITVLLIFLIIFCILEIIGSWIIDDEKTLRFVSMVGWICVLIAVISKLIHYK